MIAQLRGSIASIRGRIITIDVNGVGYETVCTMNCVARLSIGDESTVVTYTDVKQDSIRLYGFDDQMEKQVFLLLIKVNGLGARSASDMVSQIDKKELLRAIGGADLTKLQSIKGVGKKTAERIVVELKDKVAEFAVERTFSPMSIEKEVIEPFNDAIEALQALGFPRKDAEKAVRQVESAGAAELTDSGMIAKEALKYV